MSRRITKALVVSAVVCAAACPTAAIAQQRQTPPPPPRPGAARPAPRPTTSIRGFGDFGAERFAAGDTFDATLGSSTGVFFGGGVEVVLPQRLFISARLSHFQKSGERVFVDDNGEVFPLGIDMKVGITPIEVSVGYRFEARGQKRNLIPYLGGGLGWYRYTETSDFADAGEDVSDTFQGYHVLGGVEYRIGRIFGIAGDAQWTTIPNALEGAASSAADAFGESNLGGLGFAVRFVIGK